MPDFWQFPTVSMGLGPIVAIYQARFMRYLHNRGMIDADARKVWCFMGDGKVDEPESLGALSIAARERLDNLIFVINCNLQRLDGRRAAASNRGRRARLLLAQHVTIGCLAVAQRRSSSPTRPSSATCRSSSPS